MTYSQLAPKQLEAAFKEHVIEDFAQAGHIAPHEVFLAKGTKALENFGHSMETEFRKLGLPTKLNFQKIELLQDVYICRAGSKLNVEQCKLLKQLGHKMATFNINILTHRTKKGKITETDYG